MKHYDRLRKIFSSLKNAPWLQHFYQFIKHPLRTGGFWRVGSSSIHKALTLLPQKKDLKILEIGGGVWNITKELIKLSTETVEVCECNDIFIKELKKLKNTKVHKGFFEYISFDDNYDVIISTVPMSVLPKVQRQQMLQKAKTLLKPKGMYIHLQYSLFLKKDLNEIFGNSSHLFSWKDLPFVWIMKSTKNS